jgi:hypothetical protein
LESGAEAPHSKESQFAKLVALINNACYNPPSSFSLISSNSNTRVLYPRPIVYLA